MSNAAKISPERIKYLKTVRNKKTIILSSQILLLVLLFAGWELAANLRLVDPFITSQPSKVFEMILTLHADGALYHHIIVTVWETFIGFVLGTLGGILIATMLWWSEFLAKMSAPYLVVLNAVPKVALGPILIVWMGNGQPAIIAMALLISIIVSIISMLDAFLSVDVNRIKLMKTFGATKTQILTKVILPASLPNMISALKVNVGLSWVGVIMGEFLVSKAGLGYLIVYGSQVFNLDMVMTSVIILAIAAALMYVCVASFEKRMLKWQDK